MKKSLLALASGAFILGAAEFVMMGILPQAAAATGVDIPTAGHYISAYAIGVCFGTLILVFGRKVPPKDLIILFMVIALVGNLASAFSVNAAMLVVARFVAGLPHGAFFGTATLIAKTLAEEGKEAQAVSVMVTGQTVANMLGVPAGTLMAEFLSWRLAFGILAAWAAMTIVLASAWIPYVAPIKDAGIAVHPPWPVGDFGRRVHRQCRCVLLVELRLPLAAENRRMVVFPGADADDACRLWYGHRRSAWRSSDRPLEACRRGRNRSVHLLPRLVAGAYHSG